MAFGIPKEVIEEIRTRTDIVELIGSYLPLKKAGANLYKGLCPFHHEKTPSFHVNGSWQTYHCFGCQKGGDVFRFCMEKESITFVEAVHMLASRAGIIIPENSDESAAEARKRTDARERLYRINADFAEFFRQNLAGNPDSAAARYLAKRGIPADVAAKFNIGAAPDEWTACLEFGRKKGYRDAELVESGVIRRKEETGRCFDHFKGRLTFAIANEQGRVVGFSARSLEKDPQGGKYINTPETPVFKKGHLLYSMHLAKQEIAKRNLAILCEGQLDTIAFHRAGFSCAVAPQGTAFTEDQARILKRFTDRVALAFDADGAGQKAILRAVEILLPLSVEILVIRIPGGKDPDELFAHGGAEAVAAAVDGAVPWFTVLCDALGTRHDLSTPAGKGHAAVEAASYLQKVENRVELESYVKMAAERLGVGVESIYAELRKSQRKADRAEAFRLPASKVQPSMPGAPVVSTAAGVAETTQEVPSALLTLLELALHSENAAREIAEAVPPEELQGHDPVTASLNLAVNAALNGEYAELPDQLNALLTETPSEAVNALLFKKEMFSDVSRAVRECASSLHALRLREKRQKIVAAMRIAPPEERLTLLAELQALTSVPHPAQNQVKNGSAVPKREAENEKEDDDDEEIS